MSVAALSSAAASSSSSTAEKPVNLLDQRVGNVVHHLMQREAMGASSARWTRDVLYPANIQSNTYRELDLGTLWTTELQDKTICEYRQTGRNIAVVRRGSPPLLELWEGSERLWKIPAPQEVNDASILHIEGGEVLLLEQLTGTLYIYDQATGKCLRTENLGDQWPSEDTPDIISGGKIFFTKGNDENGWTVLQWDTHHEEKRIEAVPNMESQTLASPLWEKGGHLFSLDAGTWTATTGAFGTMELRVHRIKDAKTVLFTLRTSRYNHAIFRNCVAIDEHTLIYPTDEDGMNSHIHCIDLDDPKKKYVIPLPGLARVSCLTAGNGQIFVGLNTGWVGRIDTKTFEQTSSLKEAFETFGSHGQPVKQMILDGNVLFTHGYVGVSPQNRYWNAQTGELLRKERVEPFYDDDHFLYPTVLDQGLLSSTDAMKRIVLRDYYSSKPEPLVIEEDDDEEKKASPATPKRSSCR